MTTIEHGFRGPVDPALWCWRNTFGSAGGGLVLDLTDEGRARAFSVGARVRRGPPADALRALATLGGEAALSVRLPGHSTMRPTDLGRRFGGEAWGRLRALGYVRTVEGDAVRLDVVRLTTAGEQAVRDGYREQESLLRRVRATNPPMPAH
jgi:hypothetical protein